MPNQAAASDLLFYDNVVPQKVPLSKISDDVIACDLWFEPPNQKFWLRLRQFNSLTGLLILAIKFFQTALKGAKFDSNSVKMHMAIFSKKSPLSIIRLSCISLPSMLLN